MTAPDITLRIDESGTAFGAAPTWTDRTAYLTTAGDGQPIALTWGRQDRDVEVAPRTCSFELENSDGRFTPGNTAAAAGWGVGARVNVRVTVSGTTRDRFDGYVDSIEPAYGGLDWSTVLVSCTDITARLGRQRSLRSMVEQEMLADSPTYLYPLSEPSGAVAAGSIAATSAPAAPLKAGKYGAGGVAFGADAGLADPSTGLGGGTYGTRYTPVSVLAIAHNSSAGPFVPLDDAHTLECWIVAPTTAPSGLSQYLLSQFSPSYDQYVQVSINSPDGKLRYTTVDDITRYTQCSSAASICDGKLHHIVATLDPDRQTATLYLDGEFVDSDVAASPMTFYALRYNQVGGTVDGVNDGGQFAGAIALVAQYDTCLDSARVLEHYQAGIGALRERSDERYARLAGYANVPTSGLPTGVAEMGHQNTAGTNVTDALAKVARTEGSVSYVTGAGALTFQARTARYNAVTGLALTSSDSNVDTTTRDDRSGMFNEITVTRDGGAAQRVVDSAAQTAHGILPGPSWEVAPSTDRDALHNAEWLVATRSTPRSRIPSVTVDLLTIGSAGLVEDVLDADISTLLTLSDLPSQGPDTEMSVFIEGATEVIGVDQWSITFFTSPNLPATLRADAAPSDFTELDAGLLIPF